MVFYRIQCLIASSFLYLAPNFAKLLPRCALVVRARALERLLQGMEHLLPRTARAALRLHHQRQHTAALCTEDIREQLVAEHRRMLLRRFELLQRAAVALS